MTPTFAEACWECLKPFGAGEGRVTATTMGDGAIRGVLYPKGTVVTVHPACLRLVRA